MHSSNPNPRVHPADTIDPRRLDADAVRVVDRLQSAGFEAYLVGGCVRDLLVGLQPKDFDVATDARPRQIRKLFRNCRIIGRRFKLAHVVFRRADGSEHIIETATFRRAPQQGESERSSLLIRDDNEFGTAAEDAERRDFTINALFLDPRHHVILDYVGGLEDIARRRIETIGDPNIRLREDPVRVLRAVKFASRLNFRIAFDTWDAMLRHAADLHMAAVPRVLEEVLRLLRGGHAYPAFRLLAECGAMSIVLPEVAEFLRHESRRGAEGARRVDGFWRLLAALDRGVIAGDSVTNAYLHSMLMYTMYEREWESPGGPRQRHPMATADYVFDRFAERMRVPRADVARAKEICASQLRFLSRPGKRFHPAEFVQQPYFVEALAVFRARCFAAERHWDVYDAWYRLFKRRHAMERGFADAEAQEALDALQSLPMATASFEELWHLPARGGRGEQEFDDRDAKRGRGRERDRDRREHEAPRRGRGRHDAIDDRPLPADSAQALEALQESVAAAAREQPVAEAAAPTAEPVAAETAREKVPTEPLVVTTGKDGVVRTHYGVPIVFPRHEHVVRERGARETMKYKIQRPDARFEFPAAPMVRVDDGPSFGEW